MWNLNRYRCEGVQNTRTVTLAPLNKKVIALRLFFCVKFCLDDSFV